MPTTKSLLLVISLIIHQFNAQTDFCNSLCWRIADGISQASAETSYLNIVNSYPSTSFGSSACTTTTVTGVTGNDCYSCCVDISSYTELQRWTALKTINDDITSFGNSISSNIGTDLQYLTYATAEYVTVNTFCTDLSYPRICRIQLSSLAAFASDYYISLSMNTTSETLKYRMYYGSNTNWVGLGFGTASMQGEAAVYSTGKLGTDSIGIQQYTLASTSVGGVTKQSSQDLTNFAASVVDSLYLIEFDRAFDTGDNKDTVFTGTEETLSIFAAASNDDDQTLNYHGPGKLPPRVLTFVPSPADSDINWCTGGATCIIDFTAPTAEPTTSTPTVTPTTTAPTTSSPTGSPVDVYVCPNGDSLTANTVTGPFDFTFTLDCFNNKAIIRVVYSTFSDNWFGFVLNNQMSGNALLYTTGKNDDRPAGIYAYNIGARELSSITYDSSKVWDVITNTGTNGLTIEYETSLDNTPWDSNTVEIIFRYARKTSGGMAFTGKHDSTGSTVNLDLLGVTQQPTTAIPTSSPNTKQPTETTPDCPNGNTLTANTIVDDFNFTFTLNCISNAVSINILYTTYDTNWFGFVFNDEMSGNAVLYTTGKNNDRSAGIYAYSISDKSLDGVSYDSSKTWNMITNTDDSNGLQIEYFALLDDTQWDSSTTEITFRYAIGPSGLAFEGKHDLTGSIVELDLLNGGSVTTASPTIDGDEEPCGGENTLSGTGSIDDFTITTTIDCIDNTVQLDITVDNYLDGWFGIVFNNEMNGAAAVYTTGFDNDRSAALYGYDIKSKSEAGVQYNALNDWIIIEEDINDNSAFISYKQDLDKTPFTKYTTNMESRVAFGTSLQLSFHNEHRTETLDLLTGSITKDNISIQIAHGVIMWCAWAFFASIGIMGSAHRYLCEDKSASFWFLKIHRPIQTIVVVLTLIAFILAIVFTIENKNPHFNNPHMICGLIVVLLAFLQPINAFIRPHVPKPNEPKPANRFIWECIHKSSGYVAWIMGCITAYLGFRLPIINAISLSYLHLFGWCLLLLLLYAILYFIGRKRAKQQTQIIATNENEGS